MIWKTNPGEKQRKNMKIYKIAYTIHCYTISQKIDIILTNFVLTSVFG
jgi:hypothetical protein